MALVQDGGGARAADVGSSAAPCRMVAAPSESDSSSSSSSSSSEVNSRCPVPASSSLACTEIGPPPSLKPAPPISALPGIKLSEEQLAKIRAFRAVVDTLPIVDELAERPPDSKERGWLSGFFSRSSSGSFEKGEVKTLTWEEVLWLANDMVLCRYLRSYAWDQDQAQKQLLQTVRWRRNREPHRITPEAVKDTAARGSVYRRGFDVHGHPIVYFKPGREPAQSTKAAQEYTLYTMEKAIYSIDKSRGMDQLVFLVDFTGFSITQVPSMDLSKEVVGILNDHYTDILAKAYMLDAPSYFDAVWKFAKMLLHPLTASKVEFIQTSNKKELARLMELIPAEFLEETLGGSCKAGYDHEKYWQAEKKYHEDIARYTGQEVERMKADAKLQARLISAPPSPPGDLQGTGSESIEESKTDKE